MLRRKCVTGHEVFSNKPCSKHIIILVRAHFTQPGEFLYVMHVLRIIIYDTYYVCAQILLVSLNARKHVVMRYALLYLS